MIYSILIKMASVIVINRLALPNINLKFLSSLYHSFIDSHTRKVPWAVVITVLDVVDPVAPVVIS